MKGKVSVTRVLESFIFINDGFHAQVASVEKSVFAFSVSPNMAQFFVVFFAKIGLINA
jgi:hypothetical protein